MDRGRLGRGAKATRRRRSEKARASLRRRGLAGWKPALLWGRLLTSAARVAATVEGWLVNRGQVLGPFESVGLKTALVFVKPASGDAPAPADAFAPPALFSLLPLVWKEGWQYTLLSYNNLFSTARSLRMERLRLPSGEAREGPAWGLVQDVDFHCCQRAGKTTRTVVPRPGAERISHAPSSWEARSRMLDRPTVSPAVSV